MNGETNLEKLLNSMEPKLNDGDFVFCTVSEMGSYDLDKILFFFREEEGITLVLEKAIAEEWKLNFSYIASWITLTVHSSLEAVGLTAAFANALSSEQISCNVVAGYYHDHIFVNKNDAEKAMQVLGKFSD